MQPPMETDIIIGQRVRLWRRRRGLPQKTVAEKCGLTQSYLSKIEAGLARCNMRSTVAALAEALSVSVGDLTGQPGDPTSPAKISAAAAVPAIRTAIVCRHAQGAQPVRQGRHSVSDALEAIQRSDYAVLGPMLPDLIATCSGPDLIQTSYAAMYHLKYMGYEDLSREVAGLALEEARHRDEPAWLGVATYVYAASLPAETPGLAWTVAAGAADQIQHAVADTDTAQAYGMLHLTASLRAAADGNSASAVAHLREAQQQARRLGEPENHGLCGLMFGQTNSRLWEMSIWQELGQPEKAIAVAAKTPAGSIALVQRRAAYFRDLGFALTTVGDDDAAVAAFTQAESLCPQPFRLLPTVRESVEVLAHRARRRALSAPLARLAGMFDNPTTRNTYDW